MNQGHALIGDEISNLVASLANGGLRGRRFWILIQIGAKLVDEVGHRLHFVETLTLRFERGGEDARGVRFSPFEKKPNNPSQADAGMFLHRHDGVPLFHLPRPVSAREFHPGFIEPRMPSGRAAMDWNSTVARHF